jgi:hypothetical protein
MLENHEMTFGFVFCRHVNSTLTNSYWKEAYKCIRKWYPETPVLIIDDGSDKTYLIEDIALTNCTVIYERRHKGSAELLSLYYFLLLKPFDVAVVMHDSVFIQSHVDFNLEPNEMHRYLWSFPPHIYDSDSNQETIREMFSTCETSWPLYSMYLSSDAYKGCFGVMAVIRWEFLEILNEREHIFSNFLKIVRTRDTRMALERAIAVLFTFYNPKTRPPIFGNILDYMPWGSTFNNYERGDFKTLPIVKVWTGR